jgi:hypothetical protein
MNNIDRAVIIIAVALAVAMIAWMIFWPQIAAAMTLCHDAPGSTNQHWMWRHIDGRKCWFQGDDLLPRSQLKWGNQKELAAPTAPMPSPDSSDRAGPRIEHVRPRILREGDQHGPNWIDGKGGPIDLMAPGELQGASGLGGKLIIPPYRWVPE